MDNVRRTLLPAAFFDILVKAEFQCAGVQAGARDIPAAGLDH